MITRPRPRIARLVCWLIGHEPRPLTWLEERPAGHLGSTDLELVTVTDPKRTRCEVCGLVSRLDPPDPRIAQAGIRSLIGPDDTGEWGDARIRQPGGWGVRWDFGDPPPLDRADLERQLDDTLRRVPAPRRRS